MFSADTHGPDCWKCSLNVEWHDCSWCPAIIQRRGIEIRSGAAVKPSPSPSVLPDPSHRKNLPKPMKKILFPPRRPSAGFTLVELLTVIAIIGILAAMLLTVLPRVVDAAKKAKAKTEMSGLVTAIEGYDQDYGRFPLTKPELTAANGNDFTTGLVFPSSSGAEPTVYPSFDNNNQVVAILMDLQTFLNNTPTANNGHLYNPKQVKYLNARMSGYDPTTSDPNPPGGVDNSGVYRDPWGNPYVITMNTSYNEQGTSDLLYSMKSVSQSSGQTGLNGLFNPNSSNPNSDNFLFHGKVMVWSAGPDKKYNTTSANTAPNKDNVLSWQ
jgi:prepilin-type N-terminal cleavage/methylation domain-containing protein